MAMTVHVAWACGFLAFAGLEGFAKAETVAAMTQQLSDIRIGQLKSEILQTRAIQCKMIKSGDAAALQIVTRDLQNVLEAYQSITRQPYPLPPCDSL